MKVVVHTCGSLFSFLKNSRCVGGVAVMAPGGKSWHSRSCSEKEVDEMEVTGAEVTCVVFH